MEATSYILLALAGLAAGIVGGLLGLGGSSVMLPAMVWILGRADSAGHEQINQYMAAALIVNFLLILPSVVAHLHNRAVWKGIWAYLAPAGAAGIILGAWASYHVGGVYLRWGVGAFLLYVAGDNLYRMAAARRAEGLPRERVEGMPAWRKILVGFPTGAIAGLLGFGGGSLAVPGQQIVLRMPLRNAIANSAATIASISWLGAIVKNARLHPPDGTVAKSLLLAACLAPTAMIGSYLGGHLTHTLPLRIIRAAFVAVLVVSAGKMFGWL